MKLTLTANWLLLLAYLLLLPWTTTAEQLYVISSSSTSCPREPCHTLTDMVQNPSHVSENDVTRPHVTGSDLEVTFDRKSLGVAVEGL